MNQTMRDAFQGACKALGGAEAPIVLMEINRIDREGGMALTTILRMTYDMDTDIAKVRLEGHFRTKDGFVHKVGNQFEMSASELEQVKGIVNEDLKAKIDLALKSMWAVGQAEYGVKQMATQLKEKFQLPSMERIEPKLMTIGVDMAKPGEKDKSVVVIQSPAQIVPKEISAMTDAEVKAEIEHLRRKNNIVGGIGNCSSRGESEEDRRKGDLSALRALDAYCHRPIKNMGPVGPVKVTVPHDMSIHP